MTFKDLEISGVVIEDFNNELGYAVIPLKKGLNVWAEDYILTCKKKGGELKHFIIGVKPVMKKGVVVDGTKAAIAIFREFTRWTPTPYEILDCKVVGGKGGELK